jgi:hypothetical protein
MRLRIKPLAVLFEIERRMLEPRFHLPIYGHVLDFNHEKVQELECNLPVPFPAHFEGCQIFVTTPMTLIRANFCSSEMVDSDEKLGGSWEGL